MRSTIKLLAGITAALTLSCDPSVQMSDFQNYALYNQSPDRVLEALTAELVARDALSSDLASELGGSLLDAFAAGGPTQFNSESVTQSPAELAALVPEEFRHFIGDEGGRYVLELSMEPAVDGGLRLTVTPVIIATVRGGEGPLGGRPLPSNGSLESSILESLNRRLGG